MGTPQTSRGSIEDLAFLDQVAQAAMAVAEVEPAQIAEAVGLAARNGIEVVFEPRREFIVEKLGEVLFEQARRRPWR